MALGIFSSRGQTRPRVSSYHCEFLRRRVVYAALCVLMVTLVIVMSSGRVHAAKSTRWSGEGSSGTPRRTGRRLEEKEEEKKKEEEYSETSASLLALLSAVAYCDTPLILNWNCSLCTTDPRLQDISDTSVFETKAFYLAPIRAYAASFGNDAVLVFRGTQGLKDWIINLDVTRTAPWKDLCNDCYVHSGFNDAWQDLKEQVLPFLASLPGSARVHVTGHSLGAAVAALAAADLLHSTGTPSLASLYTFGSPRVGNKAFAAWLASSAKGRGYRVVNNRDIVPHLPFETQGFTHAPLEIFYEPDGNGTNTNFTICDGSGEDVHCSDQFEVTQLSIHDHFTYVNVSMQCS